MSSNIDPFYIVTYNIKWVWISGTYSITISTNMYFQVCFTYFPESMAAAGKKICLVTGASRGAGKGVAKVSRKFFFFFFFYWPGP